MGVDADGIEGPESNHIIIEDTDRPYITRTVIMALTAGQELDSIRVCFSEPMNESSVQNATWTVNAAAFQTGTGVAMAVAYDELRYVLHVFQSLLR